MLFSEAYKSSKKKLESYNEREAKNTLIDYFEANPTSRKTSITEFQARTAAIEYSSDNSDFSIMKFLEYNQFTFSTASQIKALGFFEDAGIKLKLTNI